MAQYRRQVLFTRDHDLVTGRVYIVCHVFLNFVLFSRPPGTLLSNSPKELRLGQGRMPPAQGTAAHMYSNIYIFIYSCAQ